MFSKCGTRVGQHQEVRETLLVPKKHEEKTQKHRCDIPGTPVDIRPAVLLSFCGTAAELSIQSGTRSSAKWVPYSFPQKTCKPASETGQTRGKS
jgi:hypothetical protein